MSCSICQHPKRQEIDQALVPAPPPWPLLARNIASAPRPCNATRPTCRQKSAGPKTGSWIIWPGLRFWLSQALEMTMETAQAAQAEGNGRVVLKALAQGTRLITIILKKDIPLDDRTVYELLSSPHWATQTRSSAR